MAVVDTNLFPAGFNNLCHRSRMRASQLLQSEVQSRYPKATKILIIIEEHTRNAWYLENVRTIATIVDTAGYKSIIGTFSSPDREIPASGLQLTTALGAEITITDVSHAVTTFNPDLILLNHDLSSGIPPILSTIRQPILPSPLLGWHHRRKSHHFTLVNAIITATAEKFKFDPWQFTCLHDVCGEIDIQSESDRIRLHEKASILYAQIEKKYREYHIQSSPYLVLKSDSGTYGMGVKPIAHPDEILTLNRKSRNQLSVGKNTVPISQLLIQEGIPTTTQVDGHTAEICMMGIFNQFAGGFFRIHKEKSDRDNLNSVGMHFKSICASDDPENHVVSPDCQSLENPERLDWYGFLAKVAGIASAQELQPFNLSEPDQ